MTRGTSRQAPAADQFDGMIGPGQLLAWIGSSCPFLAPQIAAVRTPDARPRMVGAGPTGWLHVLAAGPALIGAKPSSETREDYLALCLAAHHASVGSYVPTDVDNKIRGELWRRQSGEALHRRWQLARQAFAWSTTGVSTRVEFTAEGPVSGHYGEWLGVAGGALGAALLAGDQRIADEARTWMQDELAREARAYVAAEQAARDGSDEHAVALTRLAWILTHNVGDVDQGLSHWPTGAVDTLLAADRLTFAELAHERPQRFAGVFHRAKQIYQLVAAEGHRHYPLRAVKALRTDATLLLPLGPCFEAWGATVATSPALTDHDRADVLAALCSGIGKISGQIGYHRALHGVATVAGGLASLTKRLPAAAVHELDHPTVHTQLKLSREAFARQLADQVRATLARA